MTVHRGRRAAARTAIATAARRPALVRAAGQARHPQPAVTAAAGFAYESASGLPDFTLTAEQIEIDQYAQNMGWVGFYVHVKAMLGAMCPWVPAQRVGGQWVQKPGNVRMAAMADGILPPTRSQASMRFRSLRLQASIGEHAFWPVSSQDRGLVFEIAHPLQLRRGQQLGTFGVQTRRDARASTGFGYREYPIERLRRHWVPDDVWPDEATTPLAGVLKEMRLYDALVRNIGRSAESRLLMNNLLWISSDDGKPADGGEWVEAEAPDPDDDTPATPSGDDTLDEIIQDLAKAGGRAFRDHMGHDMASVLPFVMVHHTEPKMIELGRPIDKAALSGLTEVVFTAARGLNIPTQYLVSGEASANHWNDAELRRALHERAVYPELDVNNEFWTQYAFQPLLALTRPGLVALRDDDPAEWRLECDTSAIDVKSDADPMASFLNGVSSRKRAAAEAGISEDEMLELPPDVSEYEHFLYVKAAGVRAALEVMHDQALGQAPAPTTAPEALPPGPETVDAGVADEPATDEQHAVSAGALALIGRTRG